MQRRDSLTIARLVAVGVFTTEVAAAWVG